MACTMANIPTHVFEQSLGLAGVAFEALQQHSFRLEESPAWQEFSRDQISIDLKYEAWKLSCCSNFLLKKRASLHGIAHSLQAQLSKDLANTSLKTGSRKIKLDDTLQDVVRILSAGFSGNKQ